MQPLQHFTSHLGISIIWKEWLWRKNVMANPEQDYWFWGMNRPTSRSVCRPVGVVPSTGELVAEAGEGGYGEAQHEETTLHLGVGSVAPLFRRDTWKKVGKSSVSSECTGNRDGKKKVDLRLRKLDAESRNLGPAFWPTQYSLPSSPRSRSLILRCVRRIPSEICGSLTTSEPEKCERVATEVQSDICYACNNLMTIQTKIFTAFEVK